MESENDRVHLWIPTKSTIYERFVYILETFGTEPSQMLLLFTVEDDEDSVFTPAHLNSIYAAYNAIYNISLMQDGTEYTFDDLCLRAYPTADTCVSDSDSIFGNLLYLSGWSDEASVLALINSPATNGAISFYAGGFTYDTNGDISKGKIMRIWFELLGTTDATIENAVYEYQQSFTDFWFSEHNVNITGLTMNLYTDRSFDDEFSRIVTEDIGVFIASLFTMLAYLMITLGDLTCVGARPYLAVSAILVMVCSLVFGFGIAAACGFKFNTIIMLVPFILLGIGVDDIIILVDTYVHTPLPDDDILYADQRLANALVQCGLSVSLTSFCSTMAFFIGSSVDIPAVNSFCMYAAFSFLGNYFLQFLLFVPLLILDEKRVQKGRNFCIPCITQRDDILHNFEQSLHKNTNLFNKGIDQHKNVPSEDIELGATENLAHRFKVETDIKTVVEKRPTRATSGEENLGDVLSSSTKHGKNSIVNKSGKQENSKMSIQVLLIYFCVPILSRRWCRWVIIAVFLTLFSLSLYSLPNIDTTTDVSRLLSDDSYVLAFYSTYEEGFGDIFIGELDVIIQNQDFSNEEVRDDIYALIAALENHNDTIGVVGNWLEDFSTWVYNTTGNMVDDVSSSVFYNYLQIFANDSENAAWDSSIVYDNALNPTTIYGTRFILPATKNSNLKKQYPEYLEWNELLSNYTDGFIFTFSYQFAYSSTIMPLLTMENMVFASIGVLAAVLLLMDVRLAFFIVFIVGVIDVDLFGWMYMLDISLDTLSYVQLVMAVGLTVDYVIHITHAIADAEPKDINNYEERITIAFQDMGASVVKGALTTLLGVCALYFSKAQAFRIFFEMFSGIIVVAVAHGLFLTPALMGEFTWIWKGIHHSSAGSNIHKVTYDSGRNVEVQPTNHDLL